MKMRSILVGLLLMGIGFPAFADSSVTFKKVVAPKRAAVLEVAEYNNWCNLHGDDAYNIPRCGSGLINNFSNSLWGVGQISFNMLMDSGMLSGPDGLYVAPPPQGHELSTNFVNIIGDGTVYNNSPVDPNNNWHLLTADFSFVSTCIHVEKDNQGALIAVIRGVFRSGSGGNVHAIPPGVDLPGMFLVKQNQDGTDSVGSSIGDLGTTCTVNDAMNAMIDPNVVTAFGAPPLPTGYTSDNLFNLLANITNGNITIAKKK